jgi:Zn-dependent peptidase ImmA (M78 family)
MHTTSSQSTLARIRALAPKRSLDLPTALGIAERQATLLLRLNGLTVAPVSLRAIGALPCITIGLADLPTSGLSYWTGKHWQLNANRTEPEVRQRFTLAHEFKHVVDHPGRDLFYASHAERERVADHFAACLLMPKLLVTRAWCSGEQDIDRLASHFVVSVEAMTRRLLTLGLITERRARPIYCTRGAKALHPGPSLAIARQRSIGANR